jgi:PleD family two-component response regulator
MGTSAMLTSVIDLNRLTNTRTTDLAELRLATARKVVIVNGGDEVLEMLTSVLDGGQYEVMLVDTSSSAYSQIRAEQPHLVILCIRVDDSDGLRLLSMLKLDDSTRAIPVLTFTIDDSQAAEGSSRPSARHPKLAAKPASQMN